MLISRVQRGFTLVETIVSSVILCGTVIALASLSTRSLTTIQLNRQYEVARSLADRQLHLVDFVGVDKFAEKRRVEGVFDEMTPQYSWEIVTEQQDIDNLYLVKVTVSWVDRGRMYNVSVDTMLDGLGMVAASSESEQVSLDF